jgi:AcrR family transcriptional regulator
MSKPLVHTREKILDQALKMFNERGIEYVGLRELAAVLNMRVGNITYYFPTKDDLVYEISLLLSKSNAAAIVTSESMTLRTFLEGLHRAYQNQLRYRCLLLSFVHIMKQNERVAASYKQNQAVRNATIRSNIETLEQGGYLILNNEEEKNFLVSALSLISRFWISEAAVSFSGAGPEEQLSHYLQLITRLLSPYCSNKGKAHIKTFLNSL